MMLQLDDIVRELEGWTAGRALVVVGFGGTFCSGADLGSQPALFTEQYGRAMSRVMTDTTTRLRALPLVSVAAVAGAAIGGGAELTTACDYRVMMDDAFMQWVHVSRGVVPGWGGLHRLNSIVGRSHALFIAGSGKRLSAVQAASFGLADVVLPSALPHESQGSAQSRSKNVENANGTVVDNGVVADAVDRVLLHGALDFLSVSL
jgi:ethylmalonyl-CoA/methylmalonyl-CoA decarboxylase